MAELIQQILVLPEAERWNIVLTVLNSLKASQIPQDSEVPDWQLAVVNETLQRIEKGETETVSLDEFWQLTEAHKESKHL